MSEGQFRSYVKARFTEAKFRPYAQAIGQATLAWNDLHEHLGRLFGVAMTHGDRAHQLAVWQSSRSDRAKREMLWAALEMMPYEPPGWTEDLRLYGPWLKKECNGLEDRRNNAVHAPLQLVVDLRSVAWPLDKPAFLKVASVRPHTWAQNARAKGVEAKDLLKEYRACRDHAVALRDLTRDIASCIERRRRNQLKYAWPQLPQGLVARAPKVIRDHQARVAPPKV